MATPTADINTEEMDLLLTHFQEVKHSKMAQQWQYFSKEIQLIGAVWVAKEFIC